MEALSVREYRNNLAASFTKADNENKVRNEYLTDKLSGVKAIGRCPKCLGAVAYLTNPMCCGMCGNKLDWTFAK